MNLRSFYISLYIAFLSLIENTNAGNLDPLRGCVDPGTRDELQSSIDLFEAGGIMQSPRVLLLCKDTKVTFKKGDQRIYISVPNESNFVLRCEELEKCVMEGGSRGRHDEKSREQVGSGGFLEFGGFSSTGHHLHFEGIKFMNFGVSNDGGVMKFYVSGGALYLTFFKCRFTNNYAKFHGGAIYVDAEFGRLTVTLKDSEFNNNESDGYGGAMAVRNFETQEEIWVKGSHFTNNYAKTNGGGLLLAGSDLLQSKKAWFYDSTFRDNKAGINGGGLYMDKINPAKLKNIKFKDNKANRVGEAYFLFECNMKEDNVDFNDDSFYSKGSNSRTIVYK